MNLSYRNTVWGLGLIGFVLFAGCARRPPVTPQMTASDSLRAAQDESFDPFSLQEEDLMKLPDSRLKSSAGQGESSSSKSAVGRAMREAAGFRVQLVATESESEARQVEQEALLTFQESVYLTFDPPNYKVRVGDCITREDANTLLGKATNKGFGDAWVVQCRIKVPADQ